MPHRHRGKAIVLHSFPIWLPQTQTWMYNQVYYLPPDVENHIVCEKTENLDQFGLPNLHCLWEKSRLQYLWDKGLRRLGVRRHLGFLIREAKKAGARLLHSHFGYIGWGNSTAARRAGMKHIVSFYGVDVTRTPRVDERWYSRYQELFEQVDAVLCEGPFMAKSIRELGCPESKIIVQHLGVPVEEIEFRPRQWDRSEAFRVLIAATFREKKGIPYALEALGRLQREVPLEITIIGEVTGEKRSALEKEKILSITERYELAPKTHMLGFQPYSVLISQAYRHHLFLSPSVTAGDGDTEGGAPVTLIELAATGMPIVSTTHCDIPGVIKHGQTGLLADERDVDGLVRHLQWFIQHPDEWPEMLAAGRRHAEKEYDAKVQARKLAGIYDDVLQDTAMNSASNHSKIERSLH